MSQNCTLRITRQDYDQLMSHLFPGDNNEHGAVLLAGLSQDNGKTSLIVREVHIAKEKIDYVEGKIGYRALTPQFIHKMITRARDQKLVYLAVHNHFSDRSVDFSKVDFESHERGYPALLQIAKGMPVGALVLGKRSIEADVWMPNGTRLALAEALIIGKTIIKITSSPESSEEENEIYNRQIKMFGKIGQNRLKQARIGIIGLGGIGSIIAEYLARLGVGNFHLVDSDFVEESNLSRIVGACDSDVLLKREKVIVARENILRCNKDANVEIYAEDVAKESIAKVLKSCDYLFLAADSMRARLVFNAIVHQYFVPGVQMGSKIRSDLDGKLLDVMSANRPVRPGSGCLWCNQLIDPYKLATEAKSNDERKAQAYGVEEANPSIISLNAISAGHAVNDFLLDYLGLRSEGKIFYEHYHFLSDKRMLVEPRKDHDCLECSNARYGQGDNYPLPCIEG